VSPAPAQSEARFTVGRWSGTYHVPRELCDARDLQLRLDSVVAERLALVCKSFLEQSPNSSDPSIWRVRDLSLNLSLDAGFSDVHSVARNWASSLTSEILSIIENDEVSDTILRFPNRIAYLAQLVSDLASDRAWGKWYFEEFFDLQSLTSRQAICSIFLHGDTSPADLLLQIASMGRLESVLRVLSDDDARLIFDCCFDGMAASSRSGNLQTMAGIVLDFWNSAPLRAGSRAENRFRDALRLLVRTLSGYPSGQGHLQLKAVINGLLALRQILQEIHKPGLMDSLFEHLAASDVQSATEIAARCGVHNSTEALAFFAQLMQGDAAWAHQAAAVVLGDWNKEKFFTSSNIPEGESILSSFGAIFLLGPSLTASSLDELTRRASDSCDSPEKPAAVLRHLAAVKCFGGARLADTSDDAAIRLFSGREGTSFQQALKDVNVRQLNLAAAHGVLLQSLLSRHKFHEPVLIADLATFPPDKPVLILHELAQDEWLDAVPLAFSGDDTIRVLQASLQSLAPFWNLDHPVLFLGESLCSRMDMLALQQALPSFCALRRMDEPTEEKLASDLGLVRSQLTYRLESAKQQFQYFSLAAIWPGFEVDPHLDCTFTLVSRAALRHFSRKLFGFEFSSPNHIYENFLSGLSEIRRAGERLEVRLPQSPLSLILRMAGIQDQRYVLPWLKGMEVWLLPPQE